MICYGECERFRDKMYRLGTGFGQSCVAATDAIDIAHTPRQVAKLQSECRCRLVDLPRHSDPVGASQPQGRGPFPN